MPAVLHAQALADLRPDLILTQDLCRVCALPSGHVEQALDYLGCQAKVLSLDPHSLDDVLDSILVVGRRTGVPDRAARLAGGLRARLARIAARVGQFRPSPGGARPQQVSELIRDEAPGARPDTRTVKRPDSG